MKCDKPFIVAYDALFGYLYNLGGKDELLTFWKLLGDAILGQFREKAKAYGIAGMASYWAETLKAEGAHFRLTIDIPGDSLILDMDGCPSLRKLNEECIAPHCMYCHHCDNLYGKAVTEMGYLYQRVQKPKGCTIWIRRDSYCSEEVDMQPPAETS